MKLQSSIAKYKEQQENVQNNRRYDFLSKEINKKLEMKLNQNQRVRCTGTENRSCKEHRKRWDERQKDLDVKKNEYNEASLKPSRKKKS